MNKFKTFRLLCAALVVSVAGVGGVQAAVSIVAFGDSLSAGYGLGPGESFPEQLEAALKARGHDVTVANGSVSGDTASDGRARLEWSIPPEADIVIVELGANDALRGIDPEVTRQALTEIVAKLKARGQAVLLAGMLAPPNLGHSYGEQFGTIYPDLAARYDVPLYPFFLEGVATDHSLNQPDGLHPNAAGVAKIVEGILPQVETLVEASAAD